jgi:hypothetical protein
MDPEETDDVMDAEMALWLKTPEGQAAIQQIMLDVKEGRCGEVSPEMMGAAERGVATYELMQKMLEVQTRVDGLAQAMKGPIIGSRWQHLHALNQELKSIMDLLLELPEPDRTNQMKMALPLQEVLEQLEKEY